jgi:hypothetical protein
MDADDIKLQPAPPCTASASRTTRQPEPRQFWRPLVPEAPSIWASFGSTASGCFAGGKAGSGCWYGHGYIRLKFRPRKTETSEIGLPNLVMVTAGRTSMS